MKTTPIIIFMATLSFFLGTTERAQAIDRQFDFMIVEFRDIDQEATICLKETDFDTSYGPPVQMNSKVACFISNMVKGQQRVFFPTLKEEMRLLARADRISLTIPQVENSSNADIEAAIDSGLGHVILELSESISGDLTTSLTNPLKRILAVVDGFVFPKAYAWGPGAIRAFFAAMRDAGLTQAGKRCAQAGTRRAAEVGVGVTTVATVPAVHATKICVSKVARCALSSGRPAAMRACVKPVTGSVNGSVNVIIRVQPL